MAGNPPRLLCKGFIECDSFAKSKSELVARLGFSDQDIDDRLEAIVWGLNHEADYLADRIGDRILWVAVTDWPPLRVYLRPNAETFGICDLLWIEEVF
jgi:hypothetical protein